MSIGLESFGVGTVIQFLLLLIAVGCVARGTLMLCASLIFFGIAVLVNSVLDFAMGMR